MNMPNALNIKVMLDEVLHLRTQQRLLPNSG